MKRGKMIELNGEITILINCKQAMKIRNGNRIWQAWVHSRIHSHPLIYTYNHTHTLTHSSCHSLIHSFIMRGACLCRAVNKKWRRRRHFPFVRQTIILWLNFPRDGKLKSRRVDSRLRRRWAGFPVTTATTTTEKCHFIYVNTENKLSSQVKTTRVAASWLKATLGEPSIIRPDEQHNILNN